MVYRFYYIFWRRILEKGRVCFYREFEFKNIDVWGKLLYFYVIYILVVEIEDNEDIWKIFGVLIMLVRVEDSVVEKIFVKIRGLNVEVILIVYK